MPPWEVGPSGSLKERMEVGVLDLALEERREVICVLKVEEESGMLKSMGMNSRDGKAELGVGL